jgi:hypothetical protein
MSVKIPFEQRKDGLVQKMAMKVLFHWIVKIPLNLMMVLMNQVKMVRKLNRMILNQVAKEVRPWMTMTMTMTMVVEKGVTSHSIGVVLKMTFHQQNKSVIESNLCSFQTVARLLQQKNTFVG